MSEIKSLPGGSYTRLVPKIILYKVARDSAFFKFNHDLAAPLPGITPEEYSPKVYTAQGPDPADLDLSSSKVFNELDGVNLARFPFDCWIPRDIGVHISAVSGQIANVIELPPEQKTYYDLEDQDARDIILNWKNLHKGSYQADFKEFVNMRKKFLLSALQTTPLSSVIKEYDLSDFVISYTHATQLGDFNNSVNLQFSADPRSVYSSGNVIGPISSANFSDDFLKGGIAGNLVSSQLSSVPLIEENDIIEIRVRYMTPLTEGNPDRPAKESGFIDADGFQRVFIGFVSAVSRDFQYGQQENISLKCDGISKMFSIYDTTFVPSLASSAGVIMEEGVQASDLRFTLWENKFNFMSASEIFRYFMRFGLLGLSFEDLHERNIEIQKTQEALRAEMAAMKNPAAASDATKAAAAVDPASTTKSGLADTSARIKQLDARITNLEFLFKDLPTTEVQDLITKSIKSMQPGTSGVIGPDEEQLAGDQPGPYLDFKTYFTNTKLLTDASFSASFQTINFIPMLLAAAKEAAIQSKALASLVSSGSSEITDPRASLPPAEENDPLSLILATVEQGQNIAYRTLVSSAFKTFMPEMKPPSQVFSDVRSATHLEIFEDRPGILRMRPPKYNTLNLNLDIGDFPDTLGTQPQFLLPNTNPREGESDTLTLNGSFIISPFDIEGVTIHRDDSSIVTRADHSFMCPLTSSEYLQGYPGWYQDPAALMKYGLRTTGMLQNPMSITKMTADYLSALELVRRNKTARTIDLVVMNNREYQVGRLYYIPVATGEGASEPSVVSRGLVGYLTNIQTSYNYNQKPSHTLTLEHVRQAEVLRIETPVNVPIPETQASFVPPEATSIIPKKPNPSIDLYPDPSMAYVRGAIQAKSVNYAPNAVQVHYYANFKRLPDVATFIRRLSTDGDMHSDLEQGSANHGSYSAAPPSVDGAATCFGRMALNNGTKTTDLSGGVVPAYGATLNGLSGLTIPKETLTNERAMQALQFEQSVFCTPFTTAAFADADSGTANMLTNFLGKLVICEMDPLVRFYPSVTNPGFAYGITGEWASVPTTDSTTIRLTDDLLNFIVHTASAFVDDYLGTSSVFKLEQTIDIPAARIRRNAGVADTLSIQSAPGAAVIKNILAVCPRQLPNHPTLEYHTVSCFIHAENKSTHKIIRKMMVFFVPASKATRLANLINTGVFEGGGFKSLSVASKQAKTKTQATDFYSKGAAATFSDVEASLWSVSDIMGACVEFDYAEVAHGSKYMPDWVTASWNSFLNNAYNAAFEPRKMDAVYGSPALVNNGPIYTGVEISKVTYKDYGRNALGQFPSTFESLLTTYGFSTTDVGYFAEDHIDYYTQHSSYVEYINQLKSQNYVLVPTKESFFTSYFGALSTHTQKIIDKAAPPKDLQQVVSVAENSTIPATVPFFLVVCANKLVANTAGTVLTFPVATFPGPAGRAAAGILVDNRYSAFNIKMLGDTGDGYKAITNLSIDAAGMQKVPVFKVTGGYQVTKLSEFVTGTLKGPYAADQTEPPRAHAIILIDSFYFVLPPVNSKLKTIRANCAAHPLALPWHTSYAADVSDSFQSAPSEFTTRAAKGKLNLLSIPR